MINDRQPPGVDVSSYTIEEMNSITSEYTLKNNVSLSDHFYSKWIFRNNVDALDLQTNYTLTVITLLPNWLVNIYFYLCAVRIFLL